MNSDFTEQELEAILDRASYEMTIGLAEEKFSAELWFKFAQKRLNKIKKYRVKDSN